MIIVDPITHFNLSDGASNDHADTNEEQDGGTAVVNG